MITLKEEFVGGAKWKRAIKLGGAETILLWLALKRYAAEHLTDGFIPDEEVDLLPGAPPKARKALKALIECGGLEPDGSRGAGLVDQHQHGWQLHNYDDHASSSTEQELRKEKSRERKRKWRAEQERLLSELRAGQTTGHLSPPKRDGHAGHDGTEHGTVPRDTTGQKAGQVPQAGAPPHVHARAGVPAQPSPAQPVQESEREGAGRPAAGAAPTAKGPTRRWRRVPDGWEPKPEHVALAMQLGADLAAEAVKFRDHEFRDPKSDADACFRTWLRRSIELRREAVGLRVASNRAGDLLGPQLQRANALLELESGVSVTTLAPIAAPQRKALS